MTSQPAPTQSTHLTNEVLELIALASAMAANCEEAFQAHHYRLHKLGVSKEDMIKAVNIALNVKMAPHRHIVEMAEHYIVGGAAPEEMGGCCGGGSCEEDDCCGGANHTEQGGCGCH